MSHIFIRTAISAVLTFICVAAAIAQPSASVTSTGNGTYSVQGNAMDGVAGINLDISYDASSLSAPTVTQGGLVAGAMLAANTNTAGRIRIAIISTRAFSGNGQIASVSFASRSDSGCITSLTFNMIDSKGSIVASSTVGGICETPSAGSTPAATQTAAPHQDTSAGHTGQGSQQTTTTPTYLGTVTMPSEPQQQGDPKPSPAPPPPAYSDEPAAVKTAEKAATPVANKQAAERKADDTPQYVVYKGVSERFKLYKGSKKLSEIAALFDRKVSPSIKQEPDILLSNGHDKALLTVEIQAMTGSSPNFAVSGGSLVSFRQDRSSKGRWLVEVLPKANATKVTVTVIAGAEEFEYPLTVAPPVRTALTLDEHGWNVFLREVGTTAMPLHDLNNDGVRDYADEFIFVANYLARKTVPAKQASPPTKKQTP